jgi:type IV pilus assembly protein PilB
LPQPILLIRQLRRKSNSPRKWVWTGVIAEFDKLSRMVEQNATSVNEAMESFVGGEFEFDESSMDTPLPPMLARWTHQKLTTHPIVKFLHKMLLDAFNMRASDLHFEPYEFNYRVRFRVDGELREIASPPIAIKDKLASRIKVISRLDISEKRVPQDGRMKLKGRT